MDVRATVSLERKNYHDSALVVQNTILMDNASRGDGITIKRKHSKWFSKHITMNIVSHYHKAN